jgi:hypothetical protein
VAKPYVDEFYYNGGAPNAVEGMAYDLTQIPLIARDQHANPFDVHNDIEWKLADNNQTKATLDTTARTLTVEAGQVPNASYAEVILEAYSPSLNKTAKNVVVKAEQPAVLKSIKATMDNLVLRLDENARLANHFTAVGYDQYGREMQNLVFTWHTSKPDVVSLENGTLKALKEDSTEIYATADEIESNRITLTVAAPRRLTGISVSGVSSTAAKNTTFDLTKAIVKTVDQFGKEFNSDELAAYPASIRWTLEKNDTNAVIDGNTLSFGDKDGKMTLICAAVNADTNVIVDKRIDIQIGGSSSNVTVKTTFIMDKSKDEVPNPFEDVSANSYYYDAVQWAVKNGITGGTSATTFSPDAPCSRGQIVAFLWRSKQSPMVAAENPFMDVNAADYYHDAVLWAAENGITGGTGANTFSPDAPCTRAQIVTFLYRALHK